MSSPAVTLGRHSGAALIGQPLDVQFQVMLAPGEDIATQCIQADVVYGDVPVAPNFITVTPRAAPGELTGIARVVASLPINEPIVTVSVRAGCGLPFTRRYVLLADLVSEPAVVAAPAPRAAAPVPVPVPAAPVPAPAPQVAAAPTPAATPERAPAPVVRERPRPRVKPSKVPVAPRPKPAAAPAPAAVAAAAPAATPTTKDGGAQPAAGAPRLRLDPPDLSAGSSPNAAPDAGAAAAAPAEPSPLEAALAAASEESRRNAERLAALEAEMTRFREAQQRDQARVAELSAQLAQAQEQRYANWLVFLLGGLLLVSLVALVALVRRQRQDTPIASDASRAWWTDGPDEEGAAPPSASRHAALQPSAPVPLDAVEVDLDVDSTPAPLQAAPRRAPGFGATVPPQDRRDFAPSAMNVSRSVAAEELFDVQQQADFFVSLGEDDQAIAVLRNHLAESHEPSPLAYLDLFRLYHRLGRRDEYGALREEFNRVFNAGAPPFDRYADKGRGLDAYESAFGRIQALWPQPRVLDLIERSLFRDAEEGDTEVFDLEAYRELLMLHAIAKDIVQRESATLPPPEFRNTSMQPLKAVSRNAPLTVTGDDPLRRTVPMDLHVIPPALARQGLDVNLEDMEAESQFEASLPEVDVPVEPTAGRGSALRSGERSLIDFEIVDNDPRLNETRAPRDEDEDEDKGGGRRS